MAKKRWRQIKLAVIPEPEPNTRTVIVGAGEGTVLFKGPGNVRMVCGSCGRPLIVGVKPSMVQNIVLRCSNCGEFNETMA